MNKESQLTVWGDPKKRFDSAYGFIPYATWCIYEVARIRDRGGRAYVRKHRTGKTVAVFTGRPESSEVVA